MVKDQFFKSLASQGLAVTFSDVRLKTGPSSVPAHEVNIESRFSRNVPVKIPLVSAAMDTVTESTMAIELAKLGGIGVVHRSLSPEDQAARVKRVKFHLNGRIDKPIVVNENDTFEMVERMRSEKRFGFHSFPVVDGNGRLVGLISRNDFEFCDDYSQPIKKAMTTDMVTAKTGTSIDRAYDLMLKSKKKTLPLIDDDKQVTGLYVFSDVARIKRGSSRSHNVDDHGRLRVAAAVGTDEEALERVGLMHDRVDAIVIDTARGDSALALKTLAAIKADYPDVDVVVGNISEGNSARLLAEAGADGIKVGQGPGSICTTRIVAGVGCPQVTAVYSCVKAISEIKNPKHHIPVCADGGITQSGDIPIAIGAGANTVMLGRLLAGAEEAPGEIKLHKGNRMKYYRGMGSISAMADSESARERYGQQGIELKNLVAEGVESYIPVQGALTDITGQYLGGLRKGMEYVGAKNITELQRKANFYLITNAGFNESRPHDVAVVAEATRLDGLI